MDSVAYNLDNLLLSVIFGNKNFANAASRIRTEYAVEVYCFDSIGRVLFGQSTDKFTNWFNSVGSNRFNWLTDKCIHIPAGEIDEFCYTIISGKGKEGMPKFIALAHRGAHKAEFLEYCARRMMELYIWYDGADNQPNSRAMTNIDFLARELLMSNDSSINQLLGQTYLQVSSYKNDYAVAVLKQVHADHSLEKVQSDLHSSFRDCFSFINGECLLVFMFNLPSSVERMSIIQSSLRDFCIRQGARGALSSKFSDLTQRLHYVEQATDTLQLGPLYKSSPLYSADKLYAPLMMFSAFNQIGSDIALLSGIKMLSDYDKENNTEYLHSMEVYFDCSNNATTAAKELFIDRSTLKSRLEKAVAILNGNDIEDSETAIRLRTGIEMYKFYCHQHKP